MFLNTPFALPSIHPVSSSAATPTWKRRLSNACAGWKKATTSRITSPGPTRHQIQGGSSYAEVTRPCSIITHGIFQYVDNLVPLLRLHDQRICGLSAGTRRPVSQHRGAGRVNLLQLQFGASISRTTGRCTSNLTLNLGLRWEFAQPWHEITKN